ncbi:MAG TPA: hypothetical protein VGO52_14010 [Hyphomonadaceae bacterium]|jgi:hypothetical protein|nr:hypothetical protein [Hyphomonadaceae bacterium]
MTAKTNTALAAILAASLGGAAYAQEVGNFSERNVSERNFERSTELNSKEGISVGGHGPDRDSMGRQGGGEKPGLSGHTPGPAYGKGGIGLPYRVRYDGSRHYIGREAIHHRPDGSITRIWSDENYVHVDRPRGQSGSQIGWDNGISFDDAVAFEVDNDGGVVVEAGNRRESGEARAERKAAERQKDFSRDGGFGAHN